jgi:CO/xanthine dehydrogenase Mo-binding subunit
LNKRINVQAERGVTAPIDARDKVLGKAAYVDDVAVQGLQHAVLLRSPYARAKILGVTLDLEADWEGITVVTAADIPGENVVCIGESRDWPLLAADSVLHEGEVVAAVCAPSLRAARAAVKRIQVRYEPLEPLLDPRRSEDNAVRIFGQDNVFARTTVERGGTRGSGRWIECDWQVGAQDPVPLETHGVIAKPEQDGSLTLFGTMSRPEWVQQTLLEALKLSSVTIIQSVIGGGRSCRAEVPVQLAAHAALLSTCVGKPVKLQLSRTEQLRYTAKRHPLQVTLRTQVDEVGRLHRVEARLLLDGGAYATSSAKALETVLLHALGPYHCDSVHVHGVVVATNRPPNSALAEFDIAAIHFCIERQMDRIANSRTLDPVAVRKMNVLRGGDSLHTGDVLRWAVGVEVVETAERLAKAPLIAIRRPAPAKSLPGRGVGLSLCCLQPQGGGTVAVELRGAKVRVLVPYVDAGEGHPTRFAVLVSRALKLPISAIVVRPMDTSRIQPSLASPPEIQVALGRVVQRLVKIVAQEVGIRSADFARILAKRTSTKRIRVEEPILPREGLSVAFHAAIVDLLVDPDTGEVTLRRIVTTSAGRRPVHARMSQIELEGAVARAIGSALSEKLEVGPQGAWRVSGMAGIPKADAIPELITEFILAPDTLGPAEPEDGVGGAVLGAIAQAIEQATGAVIRAVPMHPEQVLEAMP